MWLLENKFVNGYKEDDRVLCVSPYNKHEKSMDIIDFDNWDEPWQSCNDSFEEMQKSEIDCEKFSGKMFYAYEGNT